MPLPTPICNRGIFQRLSAFSADCSEKLPGCCWGILLFLMALMQKKRCSRALFCWMPRCSVCLVFYAAPKRKSAMCPDRISFHSAFAFLGVSISPFFPSVNCISRFLPFCSILLNKSDISYLISRILLTFFFKRHTL